MRTCTLNTGGPMAPTQSTPETLEHIREMSFIVLLRKHFGDRPIDTLTVNDVCNALLEHALVHIETTGGPTERSVELDTVQAIDDDVRLLVPAWLCWYFRALPYARTDTALAVAIDAATDPGRQAWARRILRERTGLAIELQRTTQNAELTASLHIWYPRQPRDDCALVEFLAEELTLPIADLCDDLVIDTATLAGVPRDFADLFSVIPIRRDVRAITVAMANPMDHATIERLRLLTNCAVLVEVSSERDIDAAIERSYGPEDEDEHSWEELSTAAKLIPQKIDDTAGDPMCRAWTPSIECSPSPRTDRERSPPAASPGTSDGNPSEEPREE